MEQTTPSNPSARSATRSKGKPGRAFYEPTAEHRQLVRMLTAYGIPQDAIVKLIINKETGEPISEPTLRDRFRMEIAQGKYEADAQVIGALFKNATTPTQVYPGGNPSCQIFWVKARCGWRTVEPDEPQAPALPDVDDLEVARRVAWMLRKAAQRPKPLAIAG